MPEQGKKQELWLGYEWHWVSTPFFVRLRLSLHTIRSLAFWCLIKRPHTGTNQLTRWCSSCLQGPEHDVFRWCFVLRPVDFVLLKCIDLANLPRMERILSYTLKRKLGEGGFATVWYGLNHIGKAAAIKVLSPDLRHIPEVVERFEQEARIMAQLEHDHIRQVYDYDRDNLAIVMEYLEGQDLSAWLASHGPADAATLRTWLAQALDGMDYAHGQGVVHRDIKPSNLFLTSRGKLKILDFGIARIASAAEGRTRTGSFLGSPMFMSPEQIDDPKSVDHRCDIYSLGVTAWTLMANCKPYDDSSGSERKLLNQVAEQPLPPLQPADAGLEAWIRTCTEKDRNRRPGSAADALKLLVSSPAGREETVVVSGGGRFSYNSQIVTELASNPLPLAVAFGGVEIPFPEMVLVQGGTFWMGDDPTPGSANFRHEVTLDSFWIGKYPVTSAEYAAFLNAANPDERDRKKWVELESFWNSGFSIRREDTRFLPIRGKEQHPIVGVSWTGAIAYTEWLAGLMGAKLRLPTEAEWEYAAGGGSQGRTMWAGTDDQQNLRDFAWFSRNSIGKTHPVGQKLPNRLGLYDMSGNVWEWCEDWYGSDYYVSCQSGNPKGPPSGDNRVDRGGCWLNDPFNCRVAFRGSLNPSGRAGTLGFRLAYR